MTYSQNWLQQEWADTKYKKYKEENFSALDQYLGFPPSSILDIGCGLAWESRMFNEKYGTELWLLDGDANKNQVTVKSSDCGWNNDSNNFLFYNSLELLDIELKKRNTKKYHLIDANNISIPEDIKFDVITSWISCGYHYPISTYKDLIKKHSHENTRLIFDIRITLKTHIPYLEDSWEIVCEIQEEKRKRMKFWKHMNCEIKFK